MNYFSIYSKKIITIKRELRFYFNFAELCKEVVIYCVNF